MASGWGDVEGSRRWLTRRLGACATWQELQRVWHDYYPHTNAVHVTAAASRLAQIAATNQRRRREARGWGGLASVEEDDGGDLDSDTAERSDALCLVSSSSSSAACDRPELAKFATSLVCCAADRLSELDARGVANMLHAHASLQRDAPHSSRAAAGALAALAVAATAHARGMRPQEASNTLWAAATMGLGGRLPARWFEEFEAATLPAAARMAPREAAGALWGMARLRRVPSDAWVDAVLSSPPLRTAGAREVCTLLWALSALAVIDRDGSSSSGSGGASSGAPLASRLDASGLARCTHRLSEVLPKAGVADVTQAWLSLARLGLRPPPPLRAALLSRSAELLPAAGPRALGCALHSMARLGLDPGPHWWAAAARALAAALHAADPQGLAMMSWALGRLQPQIGRAAAAAVLGAAVESSGAVLRWQLHAGGGAGAGGGGGGSAGFSAQELAALAWGLGQAGAAAPRAWRDALRDACVGLAGGFSAGELGMVLVGLGGMQPSEGDNQTCPAAAQPAPEGDGGAAAAADAAAWGAVLGASRGALAGASARELAAVMVGCARLGLAPGRAWLSDLEAALVIQITGCPPFVMGDGQRRRRRGQEQEGAGAGAEDVAGQQEDGPTVQQQQEQQHDEQQQQQQQQGEQGRQQHGVWSGGQASGALAPGDAALLLWSLSKLGLRPGPRLARVLLPAAAASAGTMRGADAATALRALARMYSGAPGARRGAAAASQDSGAGGGGDAHGRRPGPRRSGAGRLPEGVIELVDAVLDGQRRRLASLAHRGAATRRGEDAALSEARDAALTLHALARLGHRPGAAWLDAAWLGALSPALPALAARAPDALPSVLRSFAELGAAPSGATGWLEALAAATAPYMIAAADAGSEVGEAGAWPPRRVAAMVHHLSRIDGGWVGSSWLEAACAALAPGALRALSVTELASVLTGLCRLGHAPGPAWVAAAQRELTRRQEEGECGGDEACEVWQHQALQVAAAMYGFGQG